MQNLVKVSVNTRVLMTLFQTGCAACVVLGYLGMLQTLPAILNMISALKKSVRPLIEFSFMVLVIVPLAAIIVYSGTLADERMTLPNHLASFMMSATLTGTIFQQLKFMPACI